jgi:PAS domain-containing protein
LRNANGKVTFMLGITRDITDRMRMEERLEDYEIQVRTIIDSAPEGMVLHARDGQIMDSNPAARSLLQFQGESGAGESIFEMIWWTRYFPVRKGKLMSRPARLTGTGIGLRFTRRPCATAVRKLWDCWRLCRT